MASESVQSLDALKPEGTPSEVFFRLLDAVVKRLRPDGPDVLEVPDDELHREILLPLLPAMLSDKAIRENWREQAASGFLARLTAHLAGGGPRPDWNAADFEIHVTASYRAGPDAKALADTLLSEETLRELTAQLMNRLLPAAWDDLPVVEAVPVQTMPELIAVTVDEGLPDEVVAEEVAVAAEEGEVLDVETKAALQREAAFVSYPAIRPQLPDLRRNPIRGSVDAARFGFSNWLAPNPLAARVIERKVRHARENVE